MKPLILLLLSLALLQACKPTQDLSGVPSYVHIDKATVTPDANFIDTSSRITDIWLGVNETELGAYPLPCTVPVLDAGPATVTMLAGVKQNGIAATRVPYPFYTLNAVEAIQKDTIERGKTTKLKATFSYNKNTLSWINESFRAGNATFIGLTGNNTSFIEYTTDSTSPGIGKSCMHAALTNPDRNIYYGTTRVPLRGFNPNQPVWMEISFKTDVALTVGMFIIDAQSGQSTSNDMVTLPPTNGVWKKVYIDFTTLVANTTPNSLFSMYINAGMNAGDQTDNIYITNLKILYFP